MDPPALYPNKTFKWKNSLIVVRSRFSFVKSIKDPKIIFSKRRLHLLLRSKAHETLTERIMKTTTETDSLIQSIQMCSLTIKTATIGSISSLTSSPQRQRRPWRRQQRRLQRRQRLQRQRRQQYSRFRRPATRGIRPSQISSRVSRKKELRPLKNLERPRQIFTRKVSLPSPHPPSGCATTATATRATQTNEL